MLQLIKDKLNLFLPFCHPAPGPTETSSWASLWAGRCWRSQPGGSWLPGPMLAALCRWPSSPGWPPSGPSAPRLPHSSGASGKQGRKRIFKCSFILRCTVCSFVCWIRQLICLFGLTWPTTRDSQERALISGGTPDQPWTCRLSRSESNSAASSPAQTPPSHTSSCGTRSPWCWWRQQYSPEIKRQKKKRSNI